MALTVATRVAVITCRGRSRIGLAQSRAEADRWMEDAIRYRAAGAMDRAMVSISAPAGFEPTRASAAEPGHSDIAPAAELPAPMNG